MKPSTVTPTRYDSPLREGGSLPALAEASDHELYVVKFRGTGQGRKALVAAWLAGEIARALGSRVGELVFMELDAAFGKHEGDPENHLAAIPKICAGDAEAGELGKMALAERFRWLTSPRNTLIQTSPVQSGLAENLEATLNHLLATLV